MNWFMRTETNHDPNDREECWMCDGTGETESIPVKYDGNNWLVTGPEIVERCPKCKGRGDVMAMYKRTIINGDETT